MENHLSSAHDHVPVSQLWILRLLKIDRVRRKFVRKHDFRDDDLARFLDLHYWIDVEVDQFCPRKIGRELDSRLRQMETLQLEAPRHCQRNCTMLGKAIGLNAEECRFLTSIVLFNQESALQDAFFMTDAKSHRDSVLAIATMLKASMHKISQLTSGSSQLVTAAIAKWEPARLGGGKIFKLSNPQLAEKLMDPSCTIQALLSTIAALTSPPSLNYQDYPHIKGTLSDMRLHLRRALKEKVKGVNIFIHGRPGTGKSELTRVIAREMRAKLFEVSFEDCEGDPVPGSKRLESLRLTQTLLRNQRSLLVFDEAEDVFRGESLFDRSLASKRKAWMNRVFESNEIPTFWISNSGYLDPAFLRRFDFILELKVPPRNERFKTYRRICGSDVSTNLVGRIARYEGLTPAVVAKAHSIAQGICQDRSSGAFEATFLRNVKDTLKAQGVDTKGIDHSVDKIPEVFSLRYLNTDLPLKSLPGAITQNPSCRICLYGPPGTGKTTLGYWLAEQTGYEIHLKKASDLISPYLGRTEQNIAAAFEEATEDKAILMIDEVDSFLQDRSQAVRSWEVQQVNELLTQMEHFKGTFIASTNLMDDIDQAALRRFDLKLRFGYLEGGQLTALLKSSCLELKLGHPTGDDMEAITALANATPGDFANCRRQARFRHFDSASEFAEAVAQECRIKADRGSKSLGFGSA